VAGFAARPACPANLILARKNGHPPRGRPPGPAYRRGPTTTAKEHHPQPACPHCLHPGDNRPRIHGYEHPAVEPVERDWSQPAQPP